VGWTEEISARIPEKSILFQLVVRNLLKRGCLIWLIRFWVWYAEKFWRWC